MAPLRAADSNRRCRASTLPSAPEAAGNWRRPLCGTSRNPTSRQRSPNTPQESAGRVYVEEWDTPPVSSALRRGLVACSRLIAVRETGSPLFGPTLAVGPVFHPPPNRRRDAESHLLRNGTPLSSTTKGKITKHTQAERYARKLGVARAQNIFELPNAGLQTIPHQVSFARPSVKSA